MTLAGAGVSAEAFRTERIVVAGWLPEDDKSSQRATKAFGFALDKWSDVFDAPPFSFPAPPGLTPLPRFVLQSANGTNQFDVGDIRVNLTWHNSAEPVSDPGSTADSLGSKLVALGEELGLSFTRLALVLQRRLEYQAPGAMLVTRFCKADWASGLFGGTEGFEIHSHVRRQVQSVPECNVWLRIKTGPENGPSYDHILVIQDINTVPDGVPYAPKGVATFITAALQECDVLLKQAMEGP